MPMETKRTRKTKPYELSPTSDILRNIDLKQQMSDIVLYGKNSQGKSTTLQHLIVLLLSGGKVCNPAIQKAFETAFWKHPNRYNDFMQIIFYRREVDGKNAIIYVSTRGDNWLLVEDNFEMFYQHFTRHKSFAHIFYGNKFIRLSELSKEEERLWTKERPSICISPANFLRGAIQAQRYYLDATYTDWKREQWILKEWTENPGESVHGYQAGFIKRNHDDIAKEIVKIIHDFMDNTIV